MAPCLYMFGGGQSEGHAGLKNILGGMGANICEMVNLGLPVPPGFCVSSTESIVSTDNDFPEEVQSSLRQAVAGVGSVLNSTFADPKQPLLLSVTCSAVRETGSEAGNPQMSMGTVCGVGLNDRIVEQLALDSSEHFAWDSYRRLIFTFAKVVKKLDMRPFQSEVDEAIARLDAECDQGRKYFDCDIPANQLQLIVKTYKKIYEEQAGAEFPQDPAEQLQIALKGVIRPGVAAVVQGMVFGNFDCQSAAGCVLLQQDDDSTGWKAPDDDLIGKWLRNAQTHDVWAGVREPLQVTKQSSRAMADRKGISESERTTLYPSLEEELPQVYAQLVQVKDALEYRFADVMQSELRIDFVVNRGSLWILRCPEIAGTEFTHTEEAWCKSPKVGKASIGIMMCPTTSTASTDATVEDEQADGVQTLGSPSSVSSVRSASVSSEVSTAAAEDTRQNNVDADEAVKPERLTGGASNDLTAALSRSGIPNEAAKRTFARPAALQQRDKWPAYPAGASPSSPTSPWRSRRVAALAEAEKSGLSPKCATVPGSPYPLSPSSKNHNWVDFADPNWYRMGPAVGGMPAYHNASYQGRQGSWSSTFAPPMRRVSMSSATGRKDRWMDKQAEHQQSHPMTPQAGSRRDDRNKGPALMAPLPPGPIAATVQERQPPVVEQPQEEPHTTVLLRNLPEGFTRSVLIQTLDTAGFNKKYNFVYLPVDFARGTTFDYALVNLITHEAALEFVSALDGFKDWLEPSDRLCRAALSETHEGYNRQVERYRNSPVMHPNVPDDYKPCVFQDGQRVPFPAPTRWIRFPRIRHLKA